METESSGGLDFFVADSFRVRIIQGVACVRGWERHLTRFRDSVSRITGSASAFQGSVPLLGDPHLPASIARSHAVIEFSERFDAFIASAVQRMSDFGDGFPRLEYHPSAEPDAALRVSLRALPPLGHSLELRSVPGMQLQNAGVKGPNIARLTALNRQLHAEALLLDASGAVIEGATTSLMWWRGNTLEAVADRSPALAFRVPSVTEALIVEIARDLGIPVHRTTATTASLHEAEVWALNALHGIRPVTAIDGVPQQHPDAARLSRFQDALNQRWQPLLPAQG